MQTTKTQSTRSTLWRTVLLGAVIALAVYLLGRHWHMVTLSIRAARTATPDWLSVAFVLTAMTFCIAAAIYGCLALKRLRYRQTLLVELASAFANRILPAGLGALGLHGVYLYRRKHTAAQATAVVSVNNLLGIAAHVVLLVSVVLVRPATLDKLGVHYSLRWQYVVAAAAVLIVLVCLPYVRRRLMRFGNNLLVSVRQLQPGRLVLALLLAMLLTVTYTLVLYASMRALGVRLGVLQAFIVFSIGMLVGTVTPTPGGLVGAEAGLFAGFVGYGVSSATAGAAVLVYRLFTYWLPLVPGAFALLLARRHKLV